MRPPLFPGPARQDSLAVFDDLVDLLAELDLRLVDLLQGSRVQQLPEWGNGVLDPLDAKLQRLSYLRPGERLFLSDRHASPLLGVETHDGIATARDYTTFAAKLRGIQLVILTAAEAALIDTRGHCGQTFNRRLRSTGMLRRSPNVQRSAARTRSQQMIGLRRSRSSIPTSAGRVCGAKTAGFLAGGHRSAEPARGILDGGLSRLRARRTLETHWQRLRQRGGDSTKVAWVFPAGEAGYLLACGA